MSIDYRFRNIVIAAVLAAAAVLLTVVYVSTARDESAAQKEQVTVYVPTRSFSIGTSGAKVAGSLEEKTVTRDAMAPKAVTDLEEIKSLYTTETVYAGEQLTLNRFVQAKEQGVVAKLAGRQRAFQLSGDSDQTLAGTLQPGHRVDVVANVKNPSNQNDVKSVVALRNIRVLQTQDGEGANIDNPEETTTAVILGVTDEQAQRLNWIVANGEWRFELIGVKKPKASNVPPATFQTVVRGDR